MPQNALKIRPHSELVGNCAFSSHFLGQFRMTTSSWEKRERNKRWKWEPATSHYEWKDSTQQKDRGVAQICIQSTHHQADANTKTWRGSLHLLDLVARVGDALRDALVRADGGGELGVVLDNELVQIPVAFLVSFFQAAFLSLSVLNIITGR